MELLKNVLNGALILKPKIIEDSRGYFYESYNKQDICKISGKPLNFIQDNQSLSSKGILRGLHFQKGLSAQNKLIRVIRGSIYDVAVDLRPKSPTFKKWYSVELSEINHLQFLIPKGFAHGFVSLEDNTIINYKVDSYYSHEHEVGIIWNDRELDIDWPNLPLKLSKKDQQLFRLDEINFKEIW